MVLAMMKLNKRKGYHYNLHPDTTESINVTKTLP